MKNFKKMLASILSVAVIFASSAVFAAEPELISAEIEVEAEAEASEAIAAVEKYEAFSGVVTLIEEDEENGTAMLMVKGEGKDNEAVFVISDDTYNVTGNEIEVDSEVIGYYNSSLPMTMIYPPQFKIDVIVVDLVEDSFLVKVDRFDEDLLSYDGELKLSIDKDTEVISTDGEAFDGEVAGRRLVVMYSTATKSIPALTNPMMVVVLFENITDMPQEIDEPELIEDEEELSEPQLIIDGSFPAEPTEFEFAVEDEIILADAYKNEIGAVMVPLRVIAEALGYEIGWDGETESVLINNVMSLSIGKDYYTFARMAPIELGAAPELTNSTTFVPLSFFKDVMKINNAYIFEGQIVVNNGEEME